MRNTKTHPLLPALLCGAALFTFACTGGEDRAGEVSTDKEAQSQVAVIPESPPANELRPEPQSVEIEEETPAPVDEELSGLDARERELAERQAALDARERRLREQTRPDRPVERRRTPPPPPSPRRETEERRAEVTPKPRPAPAPAPDPEPAHAEPVAEPEPAPQEAEIEPEFEEPRSPEFEEPEEPRREEPAEEPLIREATLPAGTRFDVELTSTLASNTTAPGETFRVRVAEDVMEDGEVAIPAGSEILGEVVEAVSPRRVGGQAKLQLRFTDLVLPSGVTVPIEASFVQQGRNETGRDAATIGGGAAAGAILGRVLKKGDRSRGSVIGAIIGAAAGAVIASRTPGEEVVIPKGTVMGLRLDDSVRVRVRNRG